MSVCCGELDVAVDSPFGEPTLPSMSAKNHHPLSASTVGRGLVCDGPDRYWNHRPVAQLMIDEQRARLEEARQRREARLPRFVPSSPHHGPHAA